MSQKITEDGVTKHKFWITQPVVQNSDSVDRKNANAPVREGRADCHDGPYPLPSQLEWSHIDIDNENDLNEIVDFLAKNYVEDNEAHFRFAYEPNLISWFLKCPGWSKDWHIGIRDVNTKQLLATIFAAPGTLVVNENRLEIVEIDFLCIVRELRSQRLAPLLIKEVTRRVNDTGRFQAVYTGGGVKLPGRFATTRYYHRAINFERLAKHRFYQVQPGSTLEKDARHHRLPLKAQLNMRELEPRDIPQVTKKLNDFLTRFVVHAHFSEEEAAHKFIPRGNVVFSYVAENSKTKEITHMISFYIIPSTILKTVDKEVIRAAYCFYYFYPRERSVVKNSIHMSELIESAIMKARDVNADVFNCLDIMDNGEVLQELKFHEGDGFLNYYIFNWICPVIEPKELAAVMI